MKNENLTERELYSNHDHIFLDTHLLLDTRIDRFYDRLYATAPEMQKAKYPGNEDYFVLVSKNAINEIVAFSKTRLPSPKHIAMVSLAYARLSRLHELGVLRITEDIVGCSAADSSLLSMAMANNRRLLFITNDRLLVRELQMLCGSRHCVRLVDMYGTLVSAEEANSSDRLVFDSAAGMMAEVCSSGKPGADAADAIGKGSLLYDGSGAIIMLGDEIEGGGEDFRFFAVEGCKKICAKVFQHPRAHEGKIPPSIEILCTDKFQLDAVAQPLTPLFTVDHRFQGYTLMYLSEALPLDVLFNNK